jgi:hypothetical protein
VPTLLGRGLLGQAQVLQRRKRYETALVAGEMRVGGLQRNDFNALHLDNSLVELLEQSRKDALGRNLAPQPSLLANVIARLLRLLLPCLGLPQNGIDVIPMGVMRPCYDATCSRPNNAAF